MASITPTSIPTKRLSASITSTSSSFKLNNILGWDGNALTSADFGTVAYGCFRNSSNTLMELFEWDPSTIASASITINKRGLKFTGDLTTEVTANKLIWVKGDTIVELGTDVPQLFKSHVDIYGAQTIAGVKTFSSAPVSASAPVSGSDLANKTYVDGALTGTTTVDKLVVAATAGETVSAGQLLYFDLTDNEWKKCDADTAASVDNVMLGIAQGAGTDGNAISGGVLLRGVDANQSGMSQGDLQYASNTAGGISSTTGTTERVIGIARSATNLFFDPTFYYTPTALNKASFLTAAEKAAVPSTSEKAALAGTSGTPSSTNKFVTDVEVAQTETDQSQTTQDTTSTVGEANATTKHNKLAQSFVAGQNGIRGVALYKSADTGSFTGTVTIALQADSAGAPSGSNLASVTITNAVWLLIPTGAFEAVFTAEYATVSGTTYWIVVSTSTSDNSNHPNLGANSAGGYGSGSVKFNNSTDGWTAVATIDLYFKTFEGVLNQLPKTSSTSGLLPTAVLPYSLVDLSTTSVTLTTDSTETTVYTKVLPAGFFTANSGIRVSGGASLGGSTNEEQNIAVYLNGTAVLAELGPVANSGPAYSVDVYWSVMILNQSSLSSQKYLGFASAGATTRNASNATYPDTTTSVQASYVGTSSVNTAGVVVLQVKFKSTSSAGGNTWTTRWHTVEKIG